MMWMPTRRDTLTVTGSALAALAGCTSTGTGDEKAPTSEPTPNPEPTEAPTNTPTETTVEPAATVTDSRVFTAPFFPDGEGREVPWMHTAVENPIDEYHRYVRVQSTFRDANGDVIGTWDQYTAILPPGTTWNYFARQDFDMEAYDRVEHRVAEQAVGIRGTVLENAEVLNASMSYESQFVDIVGEVDPGELQNDSIDIIGLITDEDGRFRGSVVARETDPDDTIPFDAGSVGFRTPDDEPVPSSFELLVVDGYV